MKPVPPKKKVLPTSATDFGVLGYLFVAGFEIAVPVMLGAYFDGEFNSKPWLTVIGAVLGLVGGTLHLYRVANRANRLSPPPDSAAHL